MKKITCTFYRPETVKISEFQEITNKLREDLDLICNDEVSADDVRAYAESLMAMAKPLNRNPEMYFLGLDEPEKMPGDARVDFFYTPTYLGTAIVMKAVTMYPDLLKEHGSIIHGLMLGCTGRGFRGHGFDDLEGMIGTLRIFAGANIDSFISKNPEVCIEFNNLYRDSVDMLEKLLAEGRVRNEWGEDYTETAEEVLNLSRRNNVDNEK